MQSVRKNKSVKCSCCLASRCELFNHRGNLQFTSGISAYSLLIHTLLLPHSSPSLSFSPLSLTSPVFRLSDNEIAYSDIIRDLQACRLDVSWELECLPVRMCKRKWLAMLRERYPTQTEILSQMEVVSGIRELSEGVLKYEGDMVRKV